MEEVDVAGKLEPRRPQEESSGELKGATRMTAGGQGKQGGRRVVVFQLLVMPVPLLDSRQLQVRDSVGISKISETRPPGYFDSCRFPEATLTSKVPPPYPSPTQDGKRSLKSEDSKKL